MLTKWIKEMASVLRSCGMNGQLLHASSQLPEQAAATAWFCTYRDRARTTALLEYVVTRS